LASKIKLSRPLCLGHGDWTVLLLGVAAAGLLLTLVGISL
jgi:hypothetical protein